ncbi:MAG: hypothetical protein Q7R61_02135 [bacterium]|nr:hypothetical protein [bacterium]
MFEGLKEKTEKLREKFIGPREVYFENGVSFVAKVTEEEPHLALMKDEREEFNFKSFVPPETKLIFDMTKPWGTYFKKENKPPKIVVGKFTDIDGILAFLHEAGHLANELSYNLALSAKQKHSQEINKRWEENVYDASRLLAMKHEREAVILNERNAWAFALKKARWLERTYGISILEKIGDNKKVFEFINGFLNTYEQGYLNELYKIDIFSKEQMEQLFADLEKSSQE